MLIICYNIVLVFTWVLVEFSIKRPKCGKNDHIPNLSEFSLAAISCYQSNGESQLHTRF